MLTFPLLILFASCVSVPPDRLDVNLIELDKVGDKLQIGTIVSDNPLLPAPQTGQAAALAASLARKHGFQIVEASPSTVPVCHLEYNEVAYSQALNSVHSLTAFLTITSPDGGTVLATIMVSEDSQRTLESWSVLYELFDKLFSTLRKGLDGPHPQ